MPCLVLINGAPGSGKSILAQLLAQERPMALPVDVDGLKHSLGHCHVRPSKSGDHARTLCLALVAAQLGAGYDVVVGQFLAKPDVIEELHAAAGRHGARLREFVLDLDATTLAARLASRAIAPDRPEHAVTNRLVGPADAPRLVDSLAPLRRLRPRAAWVDARGAPAETLATVRAALDA